MDWEHHVVTIFRRLVPAALLIGTAAHGQSFENIQILEMRLAAALGAGWASLVGLPARSTGG
jgi:hypothetical protein